MNIANSPVFDHEAFEERLLNMPMDAFMREMKRTTDLAKRNPRNGDIQFALALMYLRTESYANGVKHLKKALKLKPNSEKLLKTLCEVLFLEQKKFSDALKYFRKWALMRPELSDIRVNIAECLLQVNKPNAALEELDKAETLNPSDEKLWPVRAEVYTKLGDSENARKSLEAALEIKQDPLIASKLVTLPGYVPTVEALEKVRNVAEGSDDVKGANVLYSDIGSAYEKLKQYDEAFDCFMKSNEGPSKILDRENTLAGFENVKNTFTRQFLNEKSGVGNPSDRPIFIVGMPRSGTTLTESILAGHPKIIDNGELPYFHASMIKHGLNRYQDPLLKNALPTLEKFFHNAPDIYFQNEAENYFVHSGYQQRIDKYQVDKLPHNFMSVGLIHTVFPNAKIIHCRRHPVDGALSCYKASFSKFHAYATDLEFLGLYYRQYWELMNYWREVLPGKMFEVYYEDTVTNTEVVARNMIDYLGLEWDDNCLDHTRSKKTVKTASQWQVRQPIYTSSVAKWKNYEEQLKPMIKAMGSIVEQYDAELAALSAH
ncbi:MAG: sulfotransferase [Pseudomonadota bacterium]